LFRQHRDEIDGILVTLPNFGEERAIADTLRLAELNVPVLIQAFPDDATKMTIADRRDSFCGKMSACNNLTQYGIRYTLTTLHTVNPKASFRQDAPVLRRVRVKAVEKSRIRRSAAPAADTVRCGSCSNMGSRRHRTLRGLRRARRWA
jgi:L-fucose isomerase-like protein